GLHIADSAAGVCFTFHDNHGPVQVLAADYGPPAYLAEFFPASPAILDHEAGFAAVMANLRGQLLPGARGVVLAHAFVQGGLESESERLLQVGGSGAVSAEHLEG